MCQPIGPILLVEDEKVDAMLFRRALEKVTKDAPIVEVRNGEDAVDYLSGAGKYTDRTKNPLPSVVVLDVKLPRRSGFEVLEFIRSRANELRITPVMMLSSSERPMDIQQSYLRGANAYVTKPYSSAQYHEMAEAFARFWLKFNQQPNCPRLQQ